MKNKILTKAAVLAAALAVPLTSAGCSLIDDGVDRIRNMKTSSTADPLEKKSKEDRKETFNGHGYESLTTDTLTDIYTELDEKINLLTPETMWFYDGVTQRTFDEALEAYLSDHPNIFWIDETSRYSYYEDADKGSFMAELNFTIKNDELHLAKTKLESAVKRIVEKAPDNATDFDIELFVNNYIVDNCDYDKASTMRHNAYGALVDGNAVCDGYSKAFQLLCGELGVDSVVIEGDSADFDSKTDTGANVGHMWNCVRLDGDWYHVDVTWNDIGNLTEIYTDTEQYFYLNLTTEQIKQDHTISPTFGETASYDPASYYNTFVPDCYATGLNYFQRYCVTLSDAEQSDELVYALAQAGANRDSFFDFLVDESLDYDAAVDIIVENYAYLWIRQANSVNDNNPEISPQGKAYAYKNLRLITFILEYD